MRALSGHTRPYAVFGHPIGHTLSPVMHNAAFEALKLDAIYLAFDVAPDRLMAVLASARDLGFGGINLTVPLKEVAFKGLADLDVSARRLGAVNTVEFAPNGLRGHNTDGSGFLQAVDEAFGLKLKGQNLFVLGCGGAGRAVAITAAAEGAGRVVLADVDAARCEAVARDITALAPGVEAVVAGGAPAAWAALASAADLVVQASPVGMKPTDRCPLGAAAFRAGQRAFDLVYNLPETGFMRVAREGGAQAVNGLGMLLHQGAQAFTIWTGKPAAVEVMRQALEASLYGDRQAVDRR